jgi:hypothetical protein
MHFRGETSQDVAGYNKRKTTRLILGSASMRNHLTPACSGAKLLALFVFILPTLCLLGCGGGTGHTDIVTQLPSGPPTIANIAPGSGVVGASVTIAGSNFGSAQGSSSVAFGGKTASVANWTNSQIVAKVPSGASSGSVVVTVGTNASNAVSFNIVTTQPGTIALSNFGFQCGTSNNAPAANCPDVTLDGVPTPVWPTSTAQPGVLRLWDSQVAWSYLMTNYSGGVGSYNWSQLDGYLDDIETHQPINVNYVFGCVPAFATSGLTGTTPGSCGNGSSGAPVGSASPPNDLGSTGSPTFTQFVTDLMSHCSAAGNCVKNLITGFELWNEANVNNSNNSMAARWDGTPTQLYQMVAPAVHIIKTQNPNALIFTPSITANAQGWMTTWLQAEVANGIISNVYNIHQYLNNTTPEQSLTSLGNDLGPNATGAVAGWTPLPWVMGETGYDNVNLPYDCNAGNTGTQFSTDDCIGQMVRWNLLQFSNGGSGLYWYYWNTYIGSNPQYATVYNAMMHYLEGGTFGGPCTSSGNIWTCPFTDSSKNQDLWVWVSCPNDASYSSCTSPMTYPSAGYSNYIDLTSSTFTANPISGSTVPISVEPILLTP